MLSQSSLVNFASHGIALIDATLQEPGRPMLLKVYELVAHTITPKKGIINPHQLQSPPVSFTGIKVGPQSHERMIYHLSTNLSNGGIESGIP